MIPNIQDVLEEYVATANNPKYKSDWKVINSKFPELKNYDSDLLQEYVATANNPEYKSDFSVINSKFPELVSVKKKGNTEVSRSGTTLSQEKPSSLQSEEKSGNDGGLFGAFKKDVEQARLADEYNSNISTDGLVGEDAPEGYLDDPGYKLGDAKSSSLIEGINISNEEERQKAIAQANQTIDYQKKHSEQLGMDLPTYREEIKRGYAQAYLSESDLKEFKINDKLEYYTKLSKDLGPESPYNGEIFSKIKSLEKEKAKFRQEKLEKVYSRIAEIKDERLNADADDLKELNEEEKKLLATIEPVLNPVKYAKAKASTKEVAMMPGKTPMERLENYYFSIVKEQQDLAEDTDLADYLTGSVPILGGLMGSRDKRDRFYALRNDIIELTPVITLNRKELKEDDWMSQLGKSFVSTILSPGLTTTEQEQASSLYSAFEITDNLGNVNKNTREAIEASYEMTLGEEVGSAAGFTLGMIPAFMGGGGVVKGVGALAKGTKAASTISKLSNMNKATKFLVGATETGLSYEAAGLLSTSSVVEDEASFISGFMGATFAKGIGKLVPQKTYNATMLKMFGASAPKAHKIFASAIQRTGGGVGEMFEEYGNEIGAIISESGADLDKFMKLHSERFGDFDENVKFGLMTFGMGIAFGAATNAGKSFMAEHKEWLAEQSPEVQAEFNKIAGETNADLSELSNGDISEETNTNPTETLEAESISESETNKEELTIDGTSTEESTETTREETEIGQAEQDVQSDVTENTEQQEVTETVEEKGVEYKFTDTPSLKEAKAVDINDYNLSANEYADVLDIISKNENSWDKGIKGGVENLGNGWFKVGKTGDGKNILHSPRTQKTVVIESKYNSQATQDFIKNNPTNEATQEVEPDISTQIKEAKTIKEKVSIKREAAKKAKENRLETKIKEKEENVKFAEDEAENRAIEESLDKEDNVEQEPAIQAIESKAESSSEAELNEAVAEIDAKVGEATGISKQPVNSITTREGTFQNRDGLNEDKVNEIAENWDDTQQDPVHYWVDPETNEKIVISGHHRLAAAQKAGRDNILAREYKGTLDQAVKFAKEEANANRTMETPLERAKLLKEKRDRGDKDLDKFLKSEGKNARKVENLSHLNPKGKAVSMMQSLANSQDVDTQQRVAKIADWIGDARKAGKVLTDAHENEMYDFLMDAEASKRFTSKANFTEAITALRNDKNFDPSKPLGVKKFSGKGKSDTERTYDTEFEKLNNEQKELQQELNEINERLNNPLSPKYVATTDPSYDSIKRAADKKIADVNAQIKRVKQDKEKLKKRKGDVVRAAANQNDLFGGSDWGSNNTRVTTERANELREQIRKSRGNANIGLSPQDLAALVELGIYHIEAGARKLVDFAKAMRVEDSRLTDAQIESLYNDANADIDNDGKELADLYRDELSTAEEFAEATGLDQDLADRFWNEQTDTKEDAPTKSDGKEKGERQFVKKAKEEVVYENTVTLKKESIKETRERYDLDKLPPVVKKAWQTSYDNAQREGTHKKDRVDQTIKKALSGESITEEEHIGLVIRETELENQIELEQEALDSVYDSDTLEEINNRISNLIDEVSVITKAADMSGTEAARRLSIRRLAVSKDNFSIAKITKMVEKAKGGEKLTTEEKLEVSNLSKQIKDQQKKIDDLQTKADEYESERLKNEAETQISKEVKEAKRRAKSNFKRSDRNSRKKEAVDSIKDIMSRLNDITSVSETIKPLYDLARVYIEEGVDNLSDLHSSMSKDVPDITEKDVIVALITNTQENNRSAVSDTTKRLNELKKQARLKGKINDIVNGIKLPNTTNKRRNPSNRVKSLTKELQNLTLAINNKEKLDEALKLLAQIDRVVHDPTTDTDLLKEKVKDILSLVEVQKDIDKLSRQIEDLKSKDPDVREKSMNEILKTSDVKVRKSTEFTSRLNKARAKKAALQQEAVEYAKSKHKKTRGEIASELWNVTRTMKATMDLSGTLRQGAFGMLLTGRFDFFVKALMNVKTKSTEALYQGMINETNQHYRDLAGLELTHPGTSQSEEFFQSDWAKKVPGLKVVVKGSENHMSTVLNLLRVEMFDSYLEKHYKTGDVDIEDIKEFARWVNIATGRGQNKVESQSGLGKLINSSSEILFAPKYTVSRFQAVAAPIRVMGRVISGKSSKADKRIARQWIQLVGTFTIIKAAMVYLLGGDEEEDPRDSDFMKTVIGNTRYDVLAGEAQVLRILAQTVFKTLESYDIIDKDNDPNFYGYNNSGITGLWGKFIQYKLHPSISALSMFSEKKSAVGAPFMAYDFSRKYKTDIGVDTYGGILNAGEAITALVVPIVLEEIYGEYSMALDKDLKDPSVLQASVNSALTVLGASTSTYDTPKRAQDGKMFYSEIKYSPRGLTNSTPEWIKDNKYLKIAYEKSFQQEYGKWIEKQEYWEKVKLRGYLTNAEKKDAKSKMMTQASTLRVNISDKLEIEYRDLKFKYDSKKKEDVVE